MKTPLAPPLLGLLLSACSQPGNPTAAVDSILAADLRQHVERLAAPDFSGRRAGSEGGRLAGDYLAERFAAFGLQGGGPQGSFFQSFPIRDGSSRNVLAMLPGSDPELAHDWIVIGAHYDHLGTAVMLELAQAFAMAPQAPARSLLFIAFGAEEMGLVGSRYYVENAVQPLDRTLTMVNLEMMGRGDAGTVTLMVLEELPQELRTAAESAAATSPLHLVDGGRAHLRAGDQHSFYAADVPILCFYGGDNHPDYHQVSDTADKIQPDWMQSVRRLVFATVQILADPTP